MEGESSTSTSSPATYFSPGAGLTSTVFMVDSDILHIEAALQEEQADRDTISTVRLSYDTDTTLPL